MNLSTEQQRALERALHYHSSGKLQEAEVIYRGLLNEQPDQADALHYLGVIGLQVGRIDEAVDLMRRAVDARPDYVDAVVNLGNGLISLGKYEAAVEQFERALMMGPVTALVLANLGGALGQLGRYPDAIERYEAALELQPELVEARRSLADALLEIGRPTDAYRHITEAAAKGQPSVAVQVSLGNILHALGRGQDAIECFENILKVQPDFPHVRCSKANVMRQLGQVEEAIEHYEIALDQDPDYAEGHYNIGLAFQDLGEKDKALAAFRKAVTLDVNCGKAWLGISAVAKNAFDEEEVNMLLTMLQSADTASAERMGLAFALGKYFENSGQHDEATAQYLLANSLKRAIFDYDVDIDLLGMNNLRSRIDPDFLDKWRNAGLPDRTPIFVVGMPRSGTTLVEQILASHSKVFGAGELTLLARSIIETFPMPDGVDYTGALDDASTEKFQTIATKYLGGLPNTDAEYVTDKLPHNFLNVGMIRILFPNASIVHCRRDPRDTCFSIYKNLFGAHGHLYAYDLQELARYYVGYAALMDHWEDVMPGKLHTVEYENLVDNQEHTTRVLLEACGLEWDPACLEFHKTKRPIATISASQVRQPVYRGSIGAWKSYEKMLQPLLEILNHV